MDNSKQKYKDSLRAEIRELVKTQGTALHFEDYEYAEMLETKINELGDRLLSLEIDS